MSDKRKYVLIACVVVALSILGSVEAEAQSSQSCCVSAGTTTVSCNSGSGCTGTLTFHYCQGGQAGTSGQWYSDQTVYCCTTPFTNFSNPSGECYEGQAGAPTTDQTEVLLTQKVWLRSCNGRYVLLSIPFGT